MSKESFFVPAYPYPDEYDKSSPWLSLTCACHPNVITGNASRSGITPPLHPLGDRPAYLVFGAFGPHKDEEPGLFYLVGSRLIATGSPVPPTWMKRWAS